MNLLQLLFLVVISFVCGSGEFSLKFYASVSQEIAYAITANGVRTPGEVAITNPSSDWINFSASLDYPLNVEITSSQSSTRFFMHYVINYGSNGEGSQIYNSASTIYTPTTSSVCLVGTCSLEIVGDSTFVASRANVYVNNVLVVPDYHGETPAPFTVTSSDVIRIEFSYNNADTDPSYYLQDAAGELFNNWYYNAFGDNAVIFRGTSMRSPFGGPLYPISSEQSSSFATSIGQNGIWLPLTYPNP
jgi:hypothetical protein